MEYITALLQSYGYPMLFLLGMVEFLGVPIAAAPVLMVVGAASVDGTVNPIVAIGLVASGALVGESVWFGLARWRGQRLLAIACGLSSNPNVCVLSFRERMRKSGAKFLIVAKFIPAGGSVPAFAAGLAGFGYRRFLLFDAMALVLWSTLYVLAGGVFHAEVQWLIEGASAYFAWLVGVLLALFLVAVAWRIVKVRLHRALHAAHAELSREG